MPLIPPPQVQAGGIPQNAPMPSPLLRRGGGQPPAPSGTPPPVSLADTALPGMAAPPAQLLPDQAPQPMIPPMPAGSAVAITDPTQLVPPGQPVPPFAPAGLGGPPPGLGGPPGDPRAKLAALMAAGGPR
jgi:hypothetical protein